MTVEDAIALQSVHRGNEIALAKMEEALDALKEVMATQEQLAIKLIIKENR